MAEKQIAVFNWHQIPSVKKCAPVAFIGKSEAESLVKCQLAQWADNYRSIRRRNQELSVAVYGAGEAKEIPFDHVSPAHAARLEQNAKAERDEKEKAERAGKKIPLKVERLDSHAIVISDRGMSNAMQFAKFGRGERQAHYSRPKAPHPTERRAEHNAATRADFLTSTIHQKG